MEGPDMSRQSARTRLGVSRRQFLKAGLGTIAAPALTGCGLLGGESLPRPRLSARPGMPTIAPTRGLQRLGLDPLRDGNLYVPSSYISGVSWPLFVALHGAGGSADDWTDYPGRAEARSMVFLAPDSRGPTWDAILGSFDRDVGFLDRALRHTFDRCRIDPSRIALGGFSDGATYALPMGIANGDLFTHAVAYSPGYLIRTSPSSRKPRVFVSHGSRDQVLPVESSRSSIVPTLRDDHYDVTYREFDGTHQIPPEIADESLDWFLSIG